MVRLLICLLLAIPLAGCNEVELQSQWRTKPITIDGSGAEWPENGQYFDKDSGMLVSVMNDEDNIYIQLSTKSKVTKMMFLRAGFTTWIDDSGGTSKKLGVQFPMAQQDHKWGTRQDHKPRTGMAEILEDSQYSLAIINSSAGTHQTIPISQAAEMGIYARLEMKKDYLVYELEIPHAASAGNKTIGVGFEIGKMERPSRNGSPAGGGGQKGRGGGGRGGGGRGGGGGEMMGGKGGHSGGGSPGGGRPEPFDMWVKIYLASG